MPPRDDARGVVRQQRVYDDVRALGHRQSEFLVVLERGTPPRFASACDGPFSAVVIDLAALSLAVLDGSTVEH